MDIRSVLSPAEIAKLVVFQEKEKKRREKKFGGTEVKPIKKKQVKPKVEPVKKKKIKFVVKPKKVVKKPPAPAVKKTESKVKKRPGPVLTKAQQKTPVEDLVNISTPTQQKFLRKGKFLGLYDTEDDFLFDPFFNDEDPSRYYQSTPSAPKQGKRFILPDVKKKR